MRSGEECSLQAGPGEVGFLEMRFVQRHFFQVRLAQIGSREQNRCPSSLFSRGLIPLLAGEATEHTRQRKGMQVCITHVRTPQIQPRAILLLLALRSSRLSEARRASVVAASGGR